MASQNPTIFISSTFYDLRQIRADIFHYIEGTLGYRVLASEHPTFPVDPDVNTIENCRRRVQQDADIMVLIVGGRYGAIPEDLGKSVTNLEYEIARSKGIPIYTFIQRDILAVLPAWEKNPNADFSNIVDNAALFEFIQSIHSSDRHWTYPFDTAQDIVKTLRKQFAFLMMSGLKLQKRLRGQDNRFQNLSGNLLKIALEQHDGWPGSLFGQALINEIVSRQEMKHSYDLGVALGPGENINATDYKDWMQLRLSEVLRMFSAINKTVNRSLHDAFKFEDIDKIFFGARQIANIYEEAIQWSQRVRRVRVPKYFDSLTQEVAMITGQLICETEKFGPRLIEEIHRVVSCNSDEKKVELTFTIDVDNAEQLNIKLHDAVARYESEQI